MDVEVRYFSGCPNWQLAHDRVRSVLSELALDDHPVTLRAVETAEDADLLDFRGSPSVLVDGSDLFEDRSWPVGMTCRMYPSDSGLDGAPSATDLERALRQRLSSSEPAAAPCPTGINHRTADSAGRWHQHS